jgi:hypothetical protein
MSGNGNAGASQGGSSGAGGAAGWECTLNAACTRLESSQLHMEYNCMGTCTGSGSISFVPAAGFTCDVSESIYGDKRLSAYDWEPVNADVGPFYTTFVGYVGGGALQSIAEPDNNCETFDQTDIVFDQMDAMGNEEGMHAKVELNCPGYDTPVQAFVSSTTNAWACNECPYQENGEYFSAFNVGFMIEDAEVTYDTIIPIEGATSCLIQGAALLGGCTDAPACTNP